MEPDSQWIVLARILRPQGRKGEVLADLLTDFPERFAAGVRLTLAPAGFAESSGTGAALQPAEVLGYWLPVGRNVGRIVLQFAGVDSIEKAEHLAGKDVIVPLAERTPIADDSTYIADLIGCTVFDHDRAVGVVEDVEFPTTPDGSRRIEEAAPLLKIKPADGSEILIPFANAYLVEMDVAAKSIRMQLPQGLTEINLAGGNGNDEKG